MLTPCTQGSWHRQNWCHNVCWQNAPNSPSILRNLPKFSGLFPPTCTLGPLLSITLRSVQSSKVRSRNELSLMIFIICPQKFRYCRVCWCLVWLDFNLGVIFGFPIPVSQQGKTADFQKFHCPIGVTWTDAAHKAIPSGVAALPINQKGWIGAVYWNQNEMKRKGGFAVWSYATPIRELYIAVFMWVACVLQWWDGGDGLLHNAHIPHWVHSHQQLRHWTLRHRPRQISQTGPVVNAVYGLNMHHSKICSQKNVCVCRENGTLWTFLKNNSETPKKEMKTRKMTHWRKRSANTYLQLFMHYANIFA